MKSLMCVVAVLVAGSALAGDHPPEVRALVAVGAKFELNKCSEVSNPLELTSADELMKAHVFGDEASRALVARQVDFATEKLVVFAWSGSGGDTLDGKLVRRGGTAEFTYTAGRTADLRTHGAVFAVPKDVKVQVKK